MAAGVLVCVLTIVAKFVACLARAGMAEPGVDVAGSGASERGGSWRVRGFLAVRSEHGLVVGLSRNLRGGVRFEGPVARGAARRKSLGRECRFSVVTDQDPGLVLQIEEEISMRS